MRLSRVRIGVARRRARFVVKVELPVEPCPGATSGIDNLPREVVCVSKERVEISLYNQNSSKGIAHLVIQFLGVFGYVNDVHAGRTFFTCP